MTSLVPTEPERGNAPATPKDRNRLALTSFLLSLAPFVACAVLGLVEYALAQLLRTSTSTSASSAVDQVNVLILILWVAYFGSLIGSIGATVTGGLALSRAKQYPPQQAWQGLAVAGLVIGIVGIVILLCISAFALVLAG